MKAVCYARVSTSHHEQNPEVQLDELRRYCGARGWEILDEVADHGYSGATEQRPGLKRVLSLVREHRVDAVLVLKMDRLFRSLKHLLSILEEFKERRIQFVAIKDNVDYSSPAGKLFIQVLGSLAEFERELARERTLLGLAHARSKGKRLGRPSIHSRSAIKELRASGLSYRQIQRQLDVPLGCISRVLKSERNTLSNSRGTSRTTSPA